MPALKYKCEVNMDKNIENLYKEIIFKIGYYRNKNNLSARETSLQLGFSDSFVNRIERQTVELKVSTLLKFFEIVNITPQEFFYPNPENYAKDMEIFEAIKSLSQENKATILELANKLKNK